LSLQDAAYQKLQLTFINDRYKDNNVTAQARNNQQSMVSETMSTKLQSEFG